MAALDPSEDDLRALCSDRATESITLEFKRELPNRSEKGRAEFLKDVCALANTSGGRIIYGVEETDGAASGLTPIVDESFDEAQRRLGQSSVSSIEPPLSGLSFKEVRIEGGWCLLVDVPASFSAPHRYTLGGVSRFVIREPGFVRDMSYVEIRNAFTRVGEARSNARSFRQRRVEEILKGDTWQPMAKEPLCVVHAIPISAFAGMTGLNLDQTYANWDKFIQFDWGGGSRTFNLDGLVVYPGGQAPLHAYVQIYRDGVIEGIFTAGSWSIENNIPSVSVSECIRQTVFKAFAEYLRQRLAGPVIVYVSLLNVGDHRLGIGSTFPDTRQLKTDRDQLLLPDVMIEATEDVAVTEAGLRKILDMLWQSFGSPACGFYDTDGQWKPPS